MRLALYAGTFDPITRGHLSVIERAADLFDRLLVVVAVNPAKQPLFSPDERVEMIRDAVAGWRNVECTSTAGYVVELARARAARYLVRGVRSCTDVDSEIALADMNRALAPEIETVFIPAHPSLSEVSSSRLKELARLGEDLSPFCPPAIAARLQQRVATALAGEERAHV
ncbi:MAG TPA: pantetheine-phosphate adenylyltransferase [Polyangia bacterium]|jgi:pantetheine-phosphate adenylyltransferase|nr:pantetheine-phosphate adenylyltransferase [Polyangia bacterium]